MNAGPGIPIRVLGNGRSGSPSGLGGGLKAVMHEILDMLAGLIEKGEGGRIDLRSLPLSADERETLKRTLGEGEVAADLGLHTGLSRCRETAISGVWWTDHRDAGGTTIAEFIEVARIPDILVVETPDIRKGMARLEEELR